MFEWAPVATPKTVLPTELDGQMTDNLDGTYTYKYSTQWDGNITMYVLFYTQFGVYTEFFDNTAYTGTIAATRVYSQINQDFITGLVTPTQTDTVSANYFF